MQCLKVVINSNEHQQIKEVSLNAYEAIETSAEHATLKMLIKELCAVQEEKYHILTTSDDDDDDNIIWQSLFYVH